MTRAARGQLLPVLALMLCALVGGTGWLPFRQLQSLAVHPLWATVLVYVVAVVAIAGWRPQAIGQVARAPWLWLLGVAFGAMNAAFFWAVAIGDVVRVVLLFYLMPVWTSILAWWLLDERLDAAAAGRMALALAGAGLVLWPEQADGAWWQRLPWPTGLADWLALAGGAAFALNNVVLRREAARSEESQVLAMFCGGVAVAGSVALGLGLAGRIGGLPPLAVPWLLLTLALALWFLLGNFALQFGAARLPANTTAVVMLSEIVFAAGSAALLGAGEITPRVLAGAALIVAAAWLSARAAPAPPAVPA